MTQEQVETLKHFKYNPVTDRLEADKSVETILNSFYLGQQHRISSGGENVFFVNRSSSVKWFPTWQGIKEQSVPANQDMSGVVLPTYRKYSEHLMDLLDGLLTGPDYTKTILVDAPDQTVVNNLSVFGFEGITYTPLLVGDELNYVITDLSNGIVVYDQVLKVETPLAQDDPIAWWYTHPLEIHAGTTVGTEIYIMRDGERVDWYGRPDLSDENILYQKIHVRTFTDNVLEEKQIIEMLDGTAVHTHVRPTIYLIDATSNTQTIEVFSGISDSFNVRDANKAFHLNNVLVNIYGTDGVTIEHTATLDKRNTTLLFFKNGSTWYYSEEGGGETVAIASPHIQSEDFTG